MCILRFCYHLECPVAITEDGNHLAASTNGIDVHRVAADHKVHVDHRIVDAQSLALVIGLVVAIADGVIEATAHSQVADSVLIDISDCIK